MATSSSCSDLPRHPRQGSKELTDHKTGLEEVPDDIHYLIASGLKKSSPSAVLALGRSSKTLRQATLPIMFRDLVVKRGTETSRTYKAYQALIEGFRDGTGCEIADHVRNLTVKDDLPERDLILVLDKISERGTLRKLRYVERNIAAFHPQGSMTFTMSYQVDDCASISYLRWADLE